MKRMWCVIKFLIHLGAIGGTLILLGIICSNAFVISTTSNRIIDLEKIEETGFHEVNIPVLVLGAGIIDPQTPSNILAKRLDKAVEIGHKYPLKKFIMSGDHRDLYYDEVSVMKRYVVEKGILSEQVYLDHAGYSTYDSLYRLKHVLMQERVIIVTQAYHLSRALMIANRLGIKAIGIPADEVNSTRLKREFREIFARVKDFAAMYLNYSLPTPELNYSFDLSYSGDLTDDKISLKK